MTIFHGYRGSTLAIRKPLWRLPWVGCAQDPTLSPSIPVFYRVGQYIICLEVNLAEASNHFLSEATGSLIYTDQHCSCEGQLASRIQRTLESDAAALYVGPPELVTDLWPVPRNEPHLADARATDATHPGRVRVQVQQAGRNRAGHDAISALRHGACSRDYARAGVNTAAIAYPGSFPKSGPANLPLVSTP